MVDGPSIQLAYQFLNKAERIFEGSASRITIKYVRPGKSIQDDGHTLSRWPTPSFAVRVNPCIENPNGEGCELYCDYGPYAFVQNFKLSSGTGATVRVFNILEGLYSNFNFSFDRIRGERNKSSADRIRKALQTLCVQYRNDILSLKEKRDTLYVDPCYVDRNYYEETEP